MPDVNMSFSVSASKGTFTQMFSASGMTSDMAAAGMLAVSATLGTAAVTLSTTSLSSLGVAVIHNLGTDATQVVTFGRWDGTTLWGCSAPRGGEKSVMRLEPGNYAWKSNVPGTRGLVQILEG
jgi:hypothetical protein